MGVVYAEIELINSVDVENAKRYRIGEEEVRRMRLDMLVDSGAYMMAINETIQSQLEIPFMEKRKVQLASGQVVEYDVVGPIEVRFANRRAICTAFVLPGDSEPLLGAIPMEEMDVLIHPKRQELVVNPQHPNYAVLKMKGARKHHIQSAEVE
jgi:clan AA aspartic protease